MAHDLAATALDLSRRDHDRRLRDADEARMARRNGYAMDDLQPIIDGKIEDCMNIDEEDLERRLDFIVRELDECIVLAASTETYPLIEGKAIELSQIQTRIQLILSFIVSHKPTQLRIIQNG